MKVNYREQREGLGFIAKVFAQVPNHVCFCKWRIQTCFVLMNAAGPCWLGQVSSDWLVSKSITRSLCQMFLWKGHCGQGFATHWQQKLIWLIVQREVLWYFCNIFMRTQGMWPLSHPAMAACFYLNTPQLAMRSPFFFFFPVSWVHTWTFCI